MIFRFTDDELLEGLRLRKNVHIKCLYDQCWPAVRHFVRQNSGNEQDVEDIIQDTLVILFFRIRRSHFKLKSSLKTYFIAVSKNLWLQRLERNCRLLYQADCEFCEPDYCYLPEEQEMLEESAAQYRLYFKHLISMPHECRRILELYILRVPYKEIARMMKYKDEVYVKARKYTCKQMLRRMVLCDPDYLKIADDDELRILEQLD